MRINHEKAFNELIVEMLEEKRITMGNCGGKPYPTSRKQMRVRRAMFGGVKKEDYDEMATVMEHWVARLDEQWHRNSLLSRELSEAQDREAELIANMKRIVSGDYFAWDKNLYRCYSQMNPHYNQDDKASVHVYTEVRLYKRLHGWLVVDTDSIPKDVMDHFGLEYCELETNS